MNNTRTAPHSIIVRYPPGPLGVNDVDACGELAGPYHYTYHNPRLAVENRVWYMYMYISWACPIFLQI